MKRRTYVTLSMILSLGFAAACGGSKSKPDDTPAEVSHEPPSEDHVAPVPDGPPVLRGSGELTPEEAAAVEETPKEQAQEISRAALDAFMERGPAYPLTVVTVEPVHREGKFVGFQIVDVTREARAFISPQMRVGDVITHVNGVRVERPEDFLRAWKTLPDVEVIRVDFTRQNEPMKALWKVH